MNRIGLMGCAGLGKSSIASMLSKKLNLPFLESKDITRPILRMHGYQHGSGFVEKFLARCEMEEAIVSKRIEEENLLSGGFVTDRTTLECFCYAFLALETYTEEEFSLLESACRKNLEKFSHLFYFPMSAGWFEENGVRTMNLQFQRHMDLTIRGIAEEWRLPVIRVPEAAFEKKKVLDFILEKVKETPQEESPQEFPLE